MWGYAQITSCNAARARLVLQMSLCATSYAWFHCVNSSPYCKQCTYAEVGKNPMWLPQYFFTAKINVTNGSTLCLFTFLVTALKTWDQVRSFKQTENFSSKKVAKSELKTSHTLSLVCFSKITSRFCLPRPVSSLGSSIRTSRGLKGDSRQ